MIEILYQDICGLYGDYGNIMYLEQTFGKDKIIHTSILDKPYFINNEVALVYMGSMTEDNQELVIEKLRKYQTIIKDKIKDNVHFLLTGNAIEIFGNKIIDGKHEIEGLHIFNITSTRHMDKRINCHYIGLYNDIKILGFKSEFAEITSEEEPLFTTTKGFGFNKSTLKEGLKCNKTYATNVLGPLLILNPYFTKELFKDIGYNKEIPYENELIKAYDFRLDEYENAK